MNDLSEKSKTPATIERSQPAVADDLKTMPVPETEAKLAMKAPANGLER